MTACDTVSSLCVPQARCEGASGSSYSCISCQELSPTSPSKQRPSHQGQAVAGEGRQGEAEASNSLLPSFPDYGDPLTVLSPGNVLDLSSKRLILVF